MMSEMASLVRAEGEAVGLLLEPAEDSGLHQLALDLNTLTDLRENCGLHQGELALDLNTLTD